MMKRVVVLIACLLVAACGGGGDSTDAPMHLVTTSTNEGGTLTLAQSQVEDRHATTASLTVDPHYQLTAISGCGGKLSGDVFYTGVILADCNINASFKPKSYSLSVATAVGGTGMTTTPIVVYNEVGRVTLTADSGYHIKAATSNCGGSLAVNTFTTDKVTEDCLVQPVFEVDSSSVEAQTYIVTVLSAAGGTPSPESQTVAENDHAKVDFIVDDFYTLVSVTSTCGGTLVSHRFTTGKVTANCTLLPNYRASSSVITPSIDPSELSTISGTVAEGAILPINGAAAQTGAVKNKLVLAYCRDGNGFIGNPVTDANGFYTGQLRKSSLPCALQVNSNNNGYFSVVNGDVSTVNITPLTSLIIAYATATYPAVFYNFMRSSSTWPDLSDAQTTIAARLTELGYSLPAGDFQPFNTPFVPGDNWDKLIDQLSAALQTSGGSFNSLQTDFVNGDLDQIPAASQ